MFCPVCAMRAAFGAEGKEPEPGGPEQRSSIVRDGNQITKGLANPDKVAGEATRAPRIRYFGDYELLEEIARGGMGVVYRARQVSLNRTVAVKTILAGQLASAADVERFRAEAQAAASLQHPNIVAIHEVGEQDGQQYFSMDYIQGRNLAEVVREGPLTARRAAGYLKLIAEAIHYAHQRGILHRDLKPSNVLLDLFDQPRVTDFGLAKQMKADSELTRSGQVLGSPNFMPPEQAASKHGQLGPQSDVYSLGAILYHLLAGRPPFLAETLAETLQQVRESDPIPPRLLNPAVPRDLETICQKCLEKEPRRRYATANELAEELGRFLSDEPILARPVGQAEKLWRWCRRKPALAMLAASVVTLLISVAMLSLVAARRATAARDAEKRERQLAERASTNEMQLRLAAEKAEKSARTEATNSLVVAQFLQDALQSIRPSVARGRDTALLKEILDRTEQRVGTELKDQPEVEGRLRATLGQVYRDLGDHVKAEEMYRVVLAISQKLFKEPDINIAVALHNLGLELSRQGELIGGTIGEAKLDEAEKVLRQALAMNNKLHSGTHKDTVTFLSSLGGTLKRREQMEEAEELMRQAVAMGRELPQDKTMSGINALVELASLLDRTGKLSEAEELHREALARRRERLREDDLEIGQSLNNLAVVLLRQGKWAEAEPMLRQALPLMIKFLGKTHEHVAGPLENLSALMMRQSRLAEAVPLYRDLLENYRARLPADSEEVLTVAADLGSYLGMLAWTEKNGPDPAAAAAKAREGVQLLRDSLARRNQTSGRDPSRLVGTKSRLAGAIIALAASDSALSTVDRIALLEEAQPLLTSAYAAVRPNVRDGAEKSAVKRFIMLYETWERLSPGAGKAALADEWKQKLAALPPSRPPGDVSDAPTGPGPK